jgi:hypothetical protein
MVAIIPDSMVLAGIHVMGEFLTAEAQSPQIYAKFKNQNNAFLCALGVFCGKRYSKSFPVSPRLYGESLPRAGMRLVVDAGEVLEIEVGVDLRRAQVGMPKQFLYCTQVVAGLQHV